MRLFKTIVSSLVLLPMLSFAAPVQDEELDLALSRTYADVPLLCYAGLRAVVELLPELSNQLNIKMGQTMLVIDNVNTPNGYNSIFEWDVLKSITPKGVGHYAMRQTYTAPSLYLEIIQKPAGVTADQLEKIWDLVDKGMVACATNLPDNPGIPE